LVTLLVTFTFMAACGLFAIGLTASAGGGQQNDNGSGNLNSGNQNSNSGGSSRAGGQNANGSMGTGQNGNMGGGMAALSSSDRKFMQEAAVGGLSEVAMARVAVERASSEAVRDYARKMIEDHTRANEELMQLASTKGVALPTAPDAKHQQMLTRLSGMSGAAFDREYVRNAGVKSHEKMLKLVQNHSRKGRDADARAFAAKMVPAVQMHLDMARQLSTGGAAGGSMNHNTTGHSNANANLR
jgi:putative membrane protein